MRPFAEHRLKNRLCEMRIIEAWLKEYAAAAKLSDSLRHAFDVSLAEWVTNIISYAYGDGDEHWILLRFFVGPGEAWVEIEDDGRPFNPLERPPVDTRAPLETREIGGLGIHMIKQFMDAVEYRREGDRNILTLRKRIP